MKRLLAAGLAASAGAAFAQGAVYRCIDENGRPQYTNVRADTEGKKCTVVTREVSVVPGPAAPGGASASNSPRPTPAAPAPAASGTASQGGAAAASANFPRVDRDTQRSRDDSRRKILEDELAQEERSLNRARQDLNDQTAVAQRPGAAMSMEVERLRPLQDAVERHERNIAAIKKELSNIR